jgi:hypothetical protein
VLRLIDAAVKYPEGWAIRFEVRDPKGVRAAMTLVGIKLEH